MERRTITPSQSVLGPVVKQLILNDEQIKDAESEPILYVTDHIAWKAVLELVSDHSRFIQWTADTAQAMFSDFESTTMLLRTILTDTFCHPFGSQNAPWDVKDSQSRDTELTRSIPDPI